MNRTILSALLLSALALTVCREAVPEPADRPMALDDGDELKEKLLSELGRGFIGTVEGFFVVVGNLPERRFQGVVKNTVRSCAAAIHKQFGAGNV